ncbi:MAG: PHP domain-containing protein, partial [Pseudomonadota bacterium]
MTVVSAAPIAATKPADTPPTFVHLHLHTQYSIIDGLIRVPDLMKAARNDNMPAVALSDAGNLFAMVKFYKSALAKGIKPIIGVEVALAGDETDGGDRMVLLCQDVAGYRNLTRLITRAFLEGQQHGRPMVERAWMTADACSGLIALSGGFHGDVARLAQRQGDKAAAERARHWQTTFGDRYYFQISRTGRDGEQEWLASAVSLGNRLQIPLVATNDVRFLARSDYDAHEARVCIHQGRTLADSGRPKHY